MGIRLGTEREDDGSKHDMHLLLWRFQLEGRNLSESACNSNDPGVRPLCTELYGDVLTLRCTYMLQA